MAKDRAPDPFEEIIEASKRPTNDPQLAHESTTNGPQATHESTTGDTLEKHHVRFYPATWERLKAEARARGLSTSALLRMIVSEWLR